MPQFNYIRFNEYMTIKQYNKAYDSMMYSLSSSEKAIWNNGKMAEESHENNPELFAQVWISGAGEYWGLT